MSDDSVSPNGNRSLVAEQSPPGLQEPKQIQQEPISDAEVLRTAEEFLHPALFDSDRVWDFIRWVGCFCMGLDSLQTEIRQRARKYSDWPGFLASVYRLICERAKTDALAEHVRGVLAFFTRREPTPSESQKPKLAKRKMHLFRQLAVQCMRIYQNPELDGGELRRVWHSFLSGDPGARRKQMFRDAYALKSQGKDLHSICMQLRPEYAKSSPREQRKIRNSMRAGIRRFELSLKSTQTK